VTAGSSDILGRMGKIVQTAGIFTIHAGQDAQATRVSTYSIGGASGELGSVIHGLRIEVRFCGDAGPDVALSMGAADALQLAEEIRLAVHRREDVRR
jgi:hypothetical protein